MKLNAAAEKFLLYAYFGITDNDDNAKIKCAERAYLDANRNMKFNDNLKADTTENKYIKRKFREIISKEIVGEIDKLNSNNFDEKHHEICRMIINNSKNICYLKDNIKNSILESDLTYGLAQKWLNMTLKYMWMLGLLDPDLEKSLHVPVDSYIMEAAAGRKRRKGDSTEGFGIELPNKKKGIVKSYQEDKILKWSCWIGVENFDNKKESDYHNFQQQVRDKINSTPIEWENNAWIEVSERVNKAQEIVYENKFNIKVK